MWTNDYTSEFWWRKAFCLSCELFSALLYDNVYRYTQTQGKLKTTLLDNFQKINIILSLKYWFWGVGCTDNFSAVLTLCMNCNCVSTFVSTYGSRCYKLVSASDANSLGFQLAHIIWNQLQSLPNIFDGFLSFPDDHSRVVLNQSANASASDYINASTIVSFISFIHSFPLCFRDENDVILFCFSFFLGLNESLLC